MFTSLSCPFKFATYKKTLVSDKNKALLITSFTCTQYPNVVMVGSMFGDQLVLCKKNENGQLVVGNTVVDVREENMSLTNFIGNFKQSYGLDFIIIQTSAYFLINRQKNEEIRIYMTTSENYVQVFSDPEGFFGSYQEINQNYQSLFKAKLLGKQKTKKIEAVENETKEAVIEFSDTITDDEFEKIIVDSQNKLKVIRVGSLVDGIIHFERFPLETKGVTDLVRILSAMHDSEYSFIEILGNCKIAGIRNDKGIVWFVELPQEKENEAGYIRELSRLFTNFSEKEDSE